MKIVLAWVAVVSFLEDDDVYLLWISVGRGKGYKIIVETLQVKHCLDSSHSELRRYRHLT